MELNCCRVSPETYLNNVDSLPMDGFDTVDEAKKIRESTT